MGILDLGIVKFEYILLDKVKRWNFFTWAIIAISLSNNAIARYSALAFLIIGIEGTYSSQNKFRRMMPIKKSKIIMTDFIIFYSIALIMSVVSNYIIDSNVIYSLFFATVIFSISIVLRYLNGVASGIILLLVSVGAVFFNKEINLIIVKFRVNDNKLLLVMGVLMITSYIISLILYKKGRLKNKI